MDRWMNRCVYPLPSQTGLSQPEALPRNCSVTRLDIFRLRHGPPRDRRVHILSASRRSPPAAALRLHQRAAHGALAAGGAGRRLLDTRRGRGAPTTTTKKKILYVYTILRVYDTYVSSFWAAHSAPAAGGAGRRLLDPGG